MNRYDIWKTAAPPDEDDFEAPDPTVTVVISLEDGNVSVLADSPKFVRVIILDYDHDETLRPTVEEIEAAQLDDLLENLPPAGE